MKRIAISALIVGLLFLVSGGPAQAASGVDFTATLGGRNAKSINADAPLRLEPNRPLLVVLKIANGSSKPITVRSVRLDGKVLDITFFGYEVRMDAVIPAKTTASRSVVIDLVDLNDQATGHIPSRLSLLGKNREVLATDRLAVDVRGSLLSVYGAFGLGVGAVTLVLLVGAIVRLATGRLPANRWSRGSRFGIVGLGLGLTATITASAARVLTPDPIKSVSIVLGCGAVLFIVGYLTPTPAPSARRDDDSRGWHGPDDDIDLREDAALVGSRSGSRVEYAPAGQAAGPERAARPTVGRVGPFVADAEADSGRSRETVQRDHPPPPPPTQSPPPHGG
jgi:hypothetical protein